MVTFNEAETTRDEKSSPVPDQETNETDNEFSIDPVKEVKLLAKLDLAFTPIIMLVYLSCFLDRSNIGMPSSYEHTSQAHF